MDIETKNDREPEKRNDQEVSMNYQSPNISSEWQLSGSNLTNASIGMVVPSTNQMVDSFCLTTWDRPTNSPNLGFCDADVQMDLGPFRAGVDRTLGPCWSPSNGMLKGGMFLPSAPMMLPQSFMQIPADSGFIERAARFSCFSGGNFGDMMNPFSIPESSMNPYYRGLAPMQGPREVLPSNGLKSPQKLQHLSNVAESFKDVSLGVDLKVTERSPLKNEKMSENVSRSQDEAKEVAGVSGNGSDEAGCSGRQEDIAGACEESYGKNVGSTKRKRGGQDTEPNQTKRAQQPPAEIQKGEQNLNSNASKPGGKNGKQAQLSDPTKEEYIHVRARRGQATNSHSLAERIRRERISERMKYLQDLVPGCDKVTGKAVMLDEIINYVQSLQRQVEFLSMKLATVNPRLDFDIDGLLAKDILHSRAGPSSSLAFPPDMTMAYPPLHPQQAGMLQSGLPGYGFPSDAFCRVINPHLATTSCGPGDYKNPSSQAPNEWDNELHNVVQMGLSSSAPLSSQDLSGSLPAGQMKAEP